MRGEKESEKEQENRAGERSSEKRFREEKIVA